MMSLHPIAE